jgi:hypothetical protein
VADYAGLQLQITETASARVQAFSVCRTCIQVPWKEHVSAAGFHPAVIASSRTCRNVLAFSSRSIDRAYRGGNLITFFSPRRTSPPKEPLPHQPAAVSVIFMPLLFRPPFRAMGLVGPDLRDPTGWGYGMIDHEGSLCDESRCYRVQPQRNGILPNVVISNFALSAGSWRGPRISQNYLVHCSCVVRLAGMELYMNINMSENMYREIE